MLIDIPPQAVKAIDDILDTLFVVLKKLNLTLKFEAGVLVGARPADAADYTALETKGAYLSRYPWFHNMERIDKAACPAPAPGL